MEIFSQIAALTASHAHISIWNGFGHLPENIKYLFCVRNRVKYVNKMQNNSNSNSEKDFDF
jgi:hypothetical protein